MLGTSNKIQSKNIKLNSIFKLNKVYDLNIVITKSN